MLQGGFSLSLMVLGLGFRHGQSARRSQPCRCHTSESAHEDCVRAYRLNAQYLILPGSLLEQLLLGQLT